MEMFNWIIQQIASQWIAILTLVTTLVLWRYDHKKLIIEVDPVSTPIAGILVDDGQSIINRDHGMQFLNLWIVNPSVNDIAYYDLKVTLKSHTPLLYSHVQFNNSNNLKDVNPEGVMAYDEHGKPTKLLEANLPENYYGVIPAHGFVDIDLVFETDTAPDDGIVLMKLATNHTPWQAFRHSRLAPSFLRPKIGYVHSETVEVSRSFRVTKVIGLECQDDAKNDTD